MLHCCGFQYTPIYLLPACGIQKKLIVNYHRLWETVQSKYYYYSVPNVPFSDNIHDVHFSVCIESNWPHHTPQSALNCNICILDNTMATQHYISLQFFVLLNASIGQTKTLYSRWRIVAKDCSKRLYYYYYSRSHVTPASSWCSQLWVYTPLWRHSKRDASPPVHCRLSRRIGPQPSPK